MQDFVARVNSDLVGSFANLPSRSAGLLKKLENRLGRMDDAGRALVAGIEAGAAEIGRAYEACEYATAMRLAMSHADTLNRYFDNEKPWEKMKTDPERARVALTTTLNGVRLLAAYLGPVLPRYAEKVGRLLGVPTPDFQNLGERVEDRTIGAYERIAERLLPEALAAVVEATREEQAAGV
jgi:methionyl-tRNA synthetase